MNTTLLLGGGSGVAGGDLGVEIEWLLAGSEQTGSCCFSKNGSRFSCSNFCLFELLGLLGLVEVALLQLLPELSQLTGLDDFRSIPLLHWLDDISHGNSTWISLLLLDWEAGEEAIVV